MRTIMIAALLAALAACGAPPPAEPDADSAPQGEAETGEAALGASAPEYEVRTLALAEYFDCVRQQAGVLIAAHRGGPAPGYPENALETLQNGWNAGITVFEIDVAESRDGVLVLMHDRSLGRTTTGSGAVADTDWEALSRLRLVDNDGAVTAFHPPKLTDALLWAVETGAILELDRKETTSFRNIVSAVRAADAEDHVILISYDDAQAGEIAALAPDLMLTASALGGRDVAKLAAMGVARENLIAWTGTSTPDPAAFARLLQEGIEPAFGTLGRRGERLDDQWLADGDASEFTALAEAGLVLLATDRPFEIADQIFADDRAVIACGR